MSHSLENVIKKKCLDALETFGFQKLLIVGFILYTLDIYQKS